MWMWWNRGIGSAPPEPDGRSCAEPPGTPIIAAPARSTPRPIRFKCALLARSRPQNGSAPTSSIRLPTGFPLDAFQEHRSRVVVFKADRLRRFVDRELRRQRHLAFARAVL